MAIRFVRLIPEYFEIKIGNYFFQNELKQSRVNQGSQGKLVSKIGSTLAAASARSHLPLEFKLVESWEMNAKAFSGGKIVIYSQLIDRMKAEKDSLGVGHFSLKEKIAAVLSHEMAHVEYCHAVRSIQVAMLVSAFTCRLFFPVAIFIEQAVASYIDRSYEFEADFGGSLLMRKAGYNPRAVLWLTKFLDKHEYHQRGIQAIWNKVFSDHPAPIERVKRMEKILC